MRDEEHPPSQESLDRWNDWDPQNGYKTEPDLHEIPHDVDIDAYLKNESLPRRSIAPGLHAGLTLGLNVEKDEYYCSGTESVGFKACFTSRANKYIKIYFFFHILIFVRKAPDFLEFFLSL